jgi:CRISPR-associated protein Csb2
MVAAGAAHAGGVLPPEVVDALRWFEGQSAPTIVAPEARLAAMYRLSVPNNAMDKVAGAWSRGNLFGQGDANPATHKAMKSVQPVLLTGGDTIHYVWALPLEPTTQELGHIEQLQLLARRVIALGWGIDQAYGFGRVLSPESVHELSGIRWFQGTSENALRTPKPGTLDALIRRHEALLKRIGEVFAPVPGLPLTAFNSTSYRCEGQSPERRAAAFQFLKTDGSGFRAFSSLRGCEVAGMLRHATAGAARDAGWSEDRIARFVLGHGEPRGSKHATVGDERFAYLPLPSIENRQGALVVSGIRRTLLHVFADSAEQELNWARRSLSGRDLVEERTSIPRALVSVIADSDWTVQRYVGRSSTWSSVTPVILPGHDDRHRRKTDGLLRKTIIQSGFSEQLAAAANIDWRNVGFLAGTDLASRHVPPKHLAKFPRVHVRIEWCDRDGKAVPVCGPVCLGAGRYSGLGLFAAVDT